MILKVFARPAARNVADLSLWLGDFPQAVSRPGAAPYAAPSAGRTTDCAGPRPDRIYAELLRRGAGSPPVAQANRRIWTSVVEAAVPDGAAAPVVGHGDGIEPGLVACFSGADYESWGAPFGHCDGARLGLDDGRSSVSSSAGRRGSCAEEAKSGGR